ncbi:MAG: glutaredoxin family protein [Myxococcota bacterium]|nr:glutaredoxin family protein [Myxococcota bacterium]
MPTVQLMTRKGCCLCEQAKGVLLRLRQEHPFELVETDVDLDPEHRRRYGPQVPVVLVDGRPVAQLRVEEEQLRRCLTGGPAPQGADGVEAG